ncbi:MAG: MFS transporter, partial [Opitutaceae bacterium]|nr:MFS transporter [Opitutaceae bacterium]
MSTPVSPSPAAPGFTLPGLRWIVAFLLLLASVIHSVDRLIFSILAPTIQADLGLTDHDYGNVISIFLFAYAIGYLVTGRLGDRLGTRLSLGIYVAWWSLADLFTGFAKSVASLGACRFLLGIGEAGLPTTAPRVVAEWFPAKERAVAIGMYSVGGAIGATITPILAVGIANRYGWQAVFVITGIVGIAFAGLWLAIYRRPQEHPWLGAKERAALVADREAEPDTTPKIPAKQAWKILLTSPVVWTVLCSRLLTDPVWFFYNFWFAKYLNTERGFDQQALGGIWVIFLAADAGFLLSGFISMWFMRRG